MRSSRSTAGFTLIELTVAMMIAVVLFSAAVVGVGAITGSKARSAAGELGGTIRSLYDTAALSGKTCRLVFRLPRERDEDTPVSYRAECATGGLTSGRDREGSIRDEDERAKEEQEEKKLNRDTRFTSLSDIGGPSLQELLAAEKERVDNAARFASFDSDEIKPRELPSGVTLEVWTKHQREKIKHGVAYLYFYPQGFTEKAQIYIRQGDNVWTLKVSPLTGKTSVVPDEVEVPR
jgi:general secretion pathway protein H